MKTYGTILAIHDTSVALNAFVQNYRKMTLLQTPRIQQLDLLALIDSVKPLFTEVQWTTDIDASTTLKADEGLMRQVLINLAKNAVEAHARRMEVRHRGNEILVSNDGDPIPHKLMYILSVTSISNRDGILIDGISWSCLLFPSLTPTKQKNKNYFVYLRLSSLNRTF